MNEQYGFNYRDVFNETEDAIIITNGKSENIIDVNRACCDLLGYPKSEILGKTITGFLNETDISGIFTTPQKINMYGSVLSNRKVKTKDGVLIPVDMTINTFEGNKANYVMTSLRDIRERVEYEREILQINKELNEANATKDKLFSIIAHDLKNPMMSLIGFSEILSTEANEISEAEITEFSNIISSLSKSTYELLDNLLSWAQIQTKKIEIDKTEFDLFYLTEKIIGLLKPSAEIKKINLVNNVSDGFIIFADRNMVNTIIRNLISNSIKFSNENSKIEVTSVSVDGRWEIIVNDEGVGMEENYIADLFKIDVQTTRYGTKKEKGTGLGLVLCYEFAKLHGGDIKVVSEVGKGSRFSIQLPKQL